MRDRDWPSLFVSPLRHSPSDHATGRPSVSGFKLEVLCQRFESNGPKYVIDLVVVQSPKTWAAIAMGAAVWVASEYTISVSHLLASRSPLQDSLFSSASPIPTLKSS